MLKDNLLTLRKLHHYSQEAAAEKIGVSRQSLAKWENGESVPDVEKCVRMAELYQISLDDLVNFSQDKSGVGIPPKGKHLFGPVTVGEKGQIVIPKKAREVFHIQPGSTILVLGDEEQGLALISSEKMAELMNEIEHALKKED
ncbi:MAG: helix-turn-helix domain-containing protein [Erysipelotrichaceae bacterium]|nr:helix-turn-helix domain-containing protein [Erysipelotrichaceae bacterium]